MVLQERAPELAELGARGPAGQGVERLATLQEEAFAERVLLLDPHAGGVHAAEDRPVAAAHYLAADDATRQRRRVGVFLQARDAGVEPRRQAAHDRDGLPETRVGLDVVVPHHQKERLAVRVARRAVEDPGQHAS